MESGQELAEHLAGLPTACLSDAMGKRGNMQSMIKPIYSSAKTGGPAFTVFCAPADNLTVHKAVYEAPVGSVLVINARGYAEAAPFGGILALACQIRGLAGAVVDGACRDVEEIEAMGFPVFAKAANPGGTVKESLGSMGVPVRCGGLLVAPGDIVVGDSDGVVAVPEANALSVLQKARVLLEREERARELLRQGWSTLEIFGLSTVLKNKGLP